MFGFEPSEEQKMLVEAVRRYAENDLRPAAHEADENGELPPELIEKGWDLGILQASVPEAYGGFGERSAVTGVLAAEQLAWGDLGGALEQSVQGGQGQRLFPCVVERFVVFFDGPQVVAKGFLVDAS